MEAEPSLEAQAETQYLACVAAYHALLAELPSQVSPVLAASLQQVIEAGSAALVEMLSAEITQLSQQLLFNPALRQRYTTLINTYSTYQSYCLQITDQQAEKTGLPTPSRLKALCQRMFRIQQRCKDLPLQPSQCSDLSTRCAKLADDVWRLQKTVALALSEGGTHVNRR